MITEVSESNIEITFPRQFESYEYIRTMARTNSGCVILAKYSNSSDLKEEEEPSMFAIKMISREYISKNAHQMRHIEQESRVIYFLNHENILKFNETLYFDSFIAIVSEYCENGDLMSYLKLRTNISFNLKCHFLVQLINGVLYLHKHNIIHRDLKLENLFITRDNTLKIGDFGCCEIISPGNGQLKDLDILGTLFYIAPEVLRGDIVDPFKTDVWSIGIICFSLMMKMMPWTDTGNESDVYNEILNKRIDIPQFVSQPIEEVIRKCTEPNPADRPTLEELQKFKFYGQMMAASAHCCRNCRNTSRTTANVDETAPNLKGNIFSINYTNNHRYLFGFCTKLNVNNNPNANASSSSRGMGMSMTTRPRSQSIGSLFGSKSKDIAMTPIIVKSAFSKVNVFHHKNMVPKKITARSNYISAQSSMMAAETF